MFVHEERASWSEKFHKGELNSYHLEEYRKNRKNPFWRTTRELEILCEYAILLEKELEKTKRELKAVEGYIIGEYICIT